MSKINDGGLALPGYRNEQVGTVADYGVTDDESPVFGEVHHPGMSLRDHFAAQALSGWLASFGPNEGCKPAGVASFVYEIADAMLAEREKGGAS